MMNTTTLNRDVIRDLRTEINAALAAVAAKHGLSMNAGNCSFTSTSATLKLEISTISATGEVISKTLAALRSNAKWLGLTDDHLNATFQIAGHTYKLVGYNQRRYAKPFEIKCLDNGKTYITTKQQVYSALGIINSIR